VPERLSEAAVKDRQFRSPETDGLGTKSDQISLLHSHCEGPGVYVNPGDCVDGGQPRNETLQPLVAALDCFWIEAKKAGESPFLTELITCHKIPQKGRV